MTNALIIFGTRPEAIKLAPLITELKKYNDIFDVRVCITAQHREMLDQVLDFFDIHPDFDLNVMRESQTLFSLTTNILGELKPVFDAFNPDLVFVHGDTTTTLVASLAAFYANSKICHVEAGLRTNNKYSPFPEEVNRQLTARLSDYHFTPTIDSKVNLANENITKDVVVTGNTVIDALQYGVKKLENYSSEFIKVYSERIKERKVILITGHRRENHGQGIVNISKALARIAASDPEILIIYPVHLNPKIKVPVMEILTGVVNIDLVDPLAYPDFIWIMKNSYIILTDSGGIQEEAPSLGKPVLVLRSDTERPEAVAAGTVLLVGTDEDVIVERTLSLLKNEKEYTAMSLLHNPYGDGKACERIVQYLVNDLNLGVDQEKIWI